MPSPAALPRPVIRREILGWITVALLAALALVPLTAAWTQAQDLGHGWAVPLLVAYLWWERWDQRPAGVARDGLRARWWAAAALLALAALPLRLLLTLFPLWPAALAAYMSVLAATVLGGAWLAAGPAGLRWVGGPLTIVAGALPWPSLLDTKFVVPLREFLASATAEVCTWLGVPALAAGTTLRLAHSWVGVDEACGGMRSLQAGVTAALFLGEWLRLPWKRRVGLAAVAIAAAVLGNFLRILLLVWRANVGGETALASAHDLVGWVALAASLGLTGLAARRMRSAPSAAPNPARANYPRIALTWVATVAVALGLIEAGTRWWYARGEAHQAMAAAQWGVRFPTSDAGFETVPLQEGARELLRPDFFAAGEWHDENQRLISAYYVEWTRGQAARSLPFYHNPTVCLPLSGCELVRPIGTLAVRWSGGKIPFFAYVFRRYGEEFSVGFAIWDPAHGRPLVQESGGWRGWMSTRLSEVAEARAEQPAQLLSVAVWGERSEERLAGEISKIVTRR